MAMDIETRVTISLAVQRYLRAVEQFESASKDFNEACTAMREVLPDGIRMVAQIQHQHYLVTSEDKNFEVEPLETL
jgi:hypothetical protein